jgi:UDP:flavonoid glycosyltransferase YjiC (YdhE family)
MILPFSTDQFANAADLERAGVASALDPNNIGIDELARAIVTILETPWPKPQSAMTQADIIEALFG